MPDSLSTTMISLVSKIVQVLRCFNTTQIKKKRTNQLGGVIIKSASPRTVAQKLKIEWYHLKKMEEIVNNGNVRHRALPWGELARMAGLMEKKVHVHTVWKLMQDQEYHKCIACIKQ